MSHDLYNDFDLLQRASAQERVQLLIKAHEKKSEKKKSEDSEAVINLNSDTQIPNIFENKDSIFSNSMETSEDGSPPTMA